MGARDSWYSMKAAGNGSSMADIAIFSDIGGGGVTAGAFHQELSALGKRETLRISISSDGGDIAAGFAIFNMLNRNPARKVVTIEGVAASMASVIAMAGDEIVMPTNSMMMIHNPWGAVVGGSEEIASFANALDVMKTNIAKAYRARTGLPLAKIRGMMNRETWISAEDSVRLGFADRVEKAVAFNSRFDIGKFSNVPAIVARLTREDRIMSKLAKGAAENDGEGEADGGTVVRTETEIRAEILGQHKEVRALCVIAGSPELAEGYNDANKTVAEVIADLGEKAKAKAEAAAKKDGKGKPAAKGAKDEVSTHHQIGAGNGETATIDPAAIWNKFNGRTKAA